MIDKNLRHRVRPMAAAFSVFAFLAASPALSAQCAVGLTPAFPTPLALDGRTIALGDIDGVQGLDAVTNVPGMGIVAVLLNDGSGALVASPQHNVATSGFVGLADLDGMNGDDLVVGRIFPNDLAVYHNDGTGAFVPGPVYSIPGTFNDIHVVDLDGQNGDDVVAGLINGVSWLLNDGSGGFGPPQFRSYCCGCEVAVGDFDGGNGPDVAVAVPTSPSTGIIEILLNNGSGGLARAPGSPYTTPSAPNRIAAGELDGAPGDDIVYGDGSGFPVTPYTVQVMFNNGAGGFTAVPPVAAGIVNYIEIVDMDGSGAADIVLAGSGQGIRILLNDGTGTFQLSGESPTGVTWIDFAAIGDLDGQLGPDLVYTGVATVRALLNGIATPGVSGENLLGVHQNGASLAPLGFACPTVDLSAGGTYAFDVEGRASGLPVALFLQLGSCTTQPGGVVNLGTIPATTGYSIPANCAAGSNRVVNLTLAPPPLGVNVGSLSFDPGRGKYVTQVPFSLPAGTGATVSAQAVVLDASVPGGIVLSNAVNLRR